ncbi:hypothetical protein NDA16_000326 [Ustilago loliicola]|nr:hypothetical protein NDA16_000326 [Ustilago loliicola]
MSSAAASARAGPPPANAQPDRPATDWKWTLARAMLMYAGVNAVTNPKSPIAGYVGQLMGREPAAAPSVASPAVSSAGDATASANIAASTPAVGGFSALPPQVKGPPNVAVPIWQDGSQLDFYVYISSAPAPDASAIKTQASDLLPESGLENTPAIPFDAFTDLLHDPIHDVKRAQVHYSAPSSAGAKGDLKPMAAVKWTNVPLSDFDMTRDVDLTLQLGEDVRMNNASLWADFVLTKHGISPNPQDANYHPLGVVVRDPSTGDMVVAPRPSDPIAAAALDKAFSTQPGRPPNVLRYPTLFPNDFWLLKEHMHPINSTLTTLPLHIHLYHQSWFKFQTLAALSDSFDKQAGATGGEIDMIKTMLLETNPWFLALTIIVSVLHSLFEFLAFSSDVRHWKNKDDLAGRWIYGVDPTRRNEFGQTLEKADDEDGEDKKEGEKDAKVEKEAEKLVEGAKSSALEAKNELKSRAKASK